MTEQTTQGHNRVREFVERIENLEAEKKTFTDDIREVYAEAKKADLNTKALRRLIVERRQDREAVEELEEAMDIYRHALGMT